MAGAFEKLPQSDKIEVISYILQKYTNTGNVQMYMRYCVGCKMILVRRDEPCDARCECCCNAWCKECAKPLGDDILVMCFGCKTTVCPWCVKQRNDNRECQKCFYCF